MSGSDLKQGSPGAIRAPHKSVCAPVVHQIREIADRIATSCYCCLEPRF